MSTLERLLDLSHQLFMNLSDAAIYCLESQTFWKIMLILFTVILLIAGMKMIFKRDYDPWRDL